MYLKCFMAFFFKYIYYSVNGINEYDFYTAFSASYRISVESFAFQNIMRTFAQRGLDMRIIARSKIIGYYTEHPDAETALEDWFHKVKQAEWTCFADMKKMFNSVDSVGNQHYVFNIKGNNYRLIVVIKFTIKTVLIRFIGTHAEYDLIDAKNI